MPGGGGGVKRFILSGISLVMAVGFIVAWAQSNDIRSISDGLNYFRGVSSDVESCGISNLEWTCNTDLPGYDGSKKPGGSGSTSTQGGNSENEAASSATLAKLNTLEVKPSQEVDYNRSDWKHWSDLDGNGCDSREDLLVRTGKNVKTDPGTCKVLSGTWVEPYAKTMVTDSSKLDIDHIVALSHAAQNGGQKLSATQKEQLANDPQNLYISIAKENRSKGDKGPADYLPPNKDFRCEYVTAYTNVSAKYKLTITSQDKKAVENAIKTYC